MTAAPIRIHHATTRPRKEPEVPDQPTIPDEAVDAYDAAAEEVETAIANSVSAETMDARREAIRAGLAAAAPHIAAQVLRDAATALDNTGEKLHTYAAMDWAARWLRDRAGPCPTCSGPIRETVGMACQTCGIDYAVRPGSAAPTPAE